VNAQRRTQVSDQTNASGQKPIGLARVPFTAARSRDNIWSQPFSGGAPHQVTQFHSETLFCFDWCQDGQQLVFSRGVQTRDVIAVQDSREE
jgi:hypothetical protein